ncbi:MAG: pilus assembly PilX N-terminal domain-containing protein, partial [Candidatus Zixiibacteriota bacterium]
MKKGQKNERGGALLVTLAVMIMLTIAAIMAVNTAQTDMDLSFNRLHSDQAFYVAEAGLMTAFAELNKDNDWNDGYSNEIFENGTFSVAVIDSFVEVALFDTIILRAAGSIMDANANVEAMVVPEYFHPFEYAVYADINLSMDQNTWTDSYNSDLGTYDATADSVDGDLASNGTMVIDHTAIVGGDVSTSLDGGISVCATCTVYGDTATNIDPYTFPTIPDSVYDWAQLNTAAPGGL